MFDPNTMLQESRLATKDTMLNTIHFIFLMELALPSFSSSMAAAEKHVAHRCIPCRIEAVTNNNMQRATSLSFLLKPGGVDAGNHGAV
mmetsp:Transcript_4382/g.7799  ORF Transcript_4382/g.7799 Transcript_4382/m.7799 type:complete len:88 (-) Transcript_4382:320-583(-)